jgi:hypothetical protein
MRLPYYILFLLFSVVISCVSTHLDESDDRSIPVTDSDADTDTDTDTDIDTDSDTISGADTSSVPDTSISTDSGADSATNSDSGVTDTATDTETGTAIVVDTATETGTGTDGDTESSMDTNADTDTDTGAGVDTDTDTDTDTGAGVDTESSVDTNVDTDTDTGTGADSESSVDTDTGADCTVLMEGDYYEIAGNECVIVEQLAAWGTVLRLDSVDGWTPPISFDWENGCDGNIVAGGSETFSALWQTFCFADIDASCPTEVQFIGESTQSVKIRYYSSDDACIPSM